MAVEAFHEVTEQILDVTGDIIRFEPNVEREEETQTPALYAWKPLVPASMMIPFELNNIRLSHSPLNPAFQVRSANIVLTASEMEIGVDRDSKYDFDTDPFVPDVLEAFLSYLLHPHGLCISAFRSTQLQEQARRQKIVAQKGLNDGLNPYEKGFKVTDKRRV
jgi:hypothetical protein